MRFRCVKKCYLQHRLWSPGETLEANKAPNACFVPTGTRVKAEPDKESLKEVKTLLDVQERDLAVDKAAAKFDDMIF